MNSKRLNQIDQQAKSTLLCLQKLWQITHSLSNSQQPLSEAKEAGLFDRKQPETAVKMQQLTDRVSTAIGRRELYRQVVQLTILESQVQEQTAQLQQSLDFEALLKRIFDDVRDTLDERQILQTAVWELAVGLNVRCCNTGLYDTTNATSWISYEYTVGIDSTQGQVVKMQDFPVGYKQLLQGQYFQFCSLTLSWQVPAAILACPIFDDRGAIGDLWLFKQPDKAFNELEIRLVQQVASSCAIAIRQARLYQATQAKIQELETLNRLKDDFLATSQELRSPLANREFVKFTESFWQRSTFAADIDSITRLATANCRTISRAIASLSAKLLNRNFSWFTAIDL